LRISVIIPALNEAGLVGRAIGSAKGAFEVIVADGGSSDGTASEAGAAGASVVASEKGRGLQMDAAAAEAKGDVLLFLHADSLLPPRWVEAVERVLSVPGATGGAFALSVDAPGIRFRLLEWLVSVRSSCLGLIYGDQAIFARKEAFFRSGGFGKLPLMEDIDCVRRLRAQGTMALASGSVITSARRWAVRGIAANALLNSALLVLYYSGVSPDKLYSFYYKKN
jgi:rSAM/selenodomain-associated transferase 2